MIVYVITWAVLHINNGSDESQIGPDDSSKFQSVVWIGLAIGIVTSIVFHLFVKEEEGYVGNNVRGGQLRRSVSELLCSLEVYQVSITFFNL